jgi:hypothetical protein
MGVRKKKKKREKEKTVDPLSSVHVPREYEGTTKYTRRVFAALALTLARRHSYACRQEATISKGTCAIPPRNMAST